MMQVPYLQFPLLQEPKQTILDVIQQSSGSYDSVKLRQSGVRASQRRGGAYGCTETTLRLPRRLAQFHCLGLAMSGLLFLVDLAGSQEFE